MGEPVSLASDASERTFSLITHFSDPFTNMQTKMGIFDASKALFVTTSPPSLVPHILQRWAGMLSMSIMDAHGCVEICARI
jgi:hypothetical protein